MRSRLATKTSRTAKRTRPVSPPSSCQRCKFPRFSLMAWVTGALAAATAWAAALFSSSFRAAFCRATAAFSSAACFSWTSRMAGSPGAICSGVSCRAPNAAA